MRRLVLLCRHGNTFNAGERVFTVGAREDLPLTEVGEEQGRAVGRAIRAALGQVDQLRAGPLRRTADFARNIATEVGQSASVIVDERLRELDFGAWSGLSDDEIVALSGAEMLRQWREHGIRPTGVEFSPAEQELEREVSAFLSDLSREEGFAVVVTSNGRLREFARILTHGHDRAGRVRTGASCLLECREGAWKILGWDLHPEDLFHLLTKEATASS